MDFTTIPHGCLSTGTTTRFGTIERVSLTAYLINGAWVPFAKVHGAYQPAEILSAPFAQ